MSVTAAVAGVDNTTSGAARRTRRYQILWLDHGTDPADGVYAYPVMPGATPRTVAARAADPRRLEALDNTVARRAARVPSPGLTFADFRQPGTVGPLTGTAPASVAVRRRGRTAAPHIGEPPRTGRPLETTWHRLARTGSSPTTRPPRYCPPGPPRGCGSPPAPRAPLVAARRPGAGPPRLPDDPLVDIPQAIGVQRWHFGCTPKRFCSGHTADQSGDCTESTAGFPWSAP